MSEATLRDGTRVTIRPIEPDDKEGLARGFERLSPESRYRRFFRPLRRLSAADLRYLTEVDHDDHEALVAVHDADAGPELIGVARYVRSDEDPTAAEVAVTVLDDWHGRGVASELLRRLVRRAREQRVERFVALVLGENRDALELFQHVAANDARPRRREGYVELLIELPEERLAGTALGRALRTAAAGTVQFNPARLLKAVLDERRDER